MDKILDVPTNVITGFFGVGKTTAIRHLLSKKPDAERWAILVNEFGEVPIDQAALTAGDEEGTGGVMIREIAGGCLCCTMNMPMQVAVAEILRRARPDRLLIEPTGLGHPAGIVDALRDPPLAEAIDLRAVICLVDPRYIGDPRIQSAEAFRDQAHLADILVANKSDLADLDQRRAFDEWAAGLFPAKLKIAQTTQAEIDLEDLDFPATARAPLFPDAHTHRDATSAPSEPPPLTPGAPVRQMSHGHGYVGSGWIFAAADRFDHDELLDLLGPPGFPGLGGGATPQRVKGVFHTARGWYLIDRAGNEVSVSESAHRRDSRLEVIVADDTEIDWDELVAALSACLLRA